MPEPKPKYDLYEISISKDEIFSRAENLPLSELDAVILRLREIRTNQLMQEPDANILLILVDQVGWTIDQARKYILLRLNFSSLNNSDKRELISMGVTLRRLNLFEEVDAMIISKRDANVRDKT